MAGQLYPKWRIALLAPTEASKDTLLAILKVKSRLTAKAVALTTCITSRDIGSLLFRRAENGPNGNGAKSERWSGKRIMRREEEDGEKRGRWSEEGIGRDRFGSCPLYTSLWGQNALICASFLGIWGCSIQ